MSYVSSEAPALTIAKALSLVPDDHVQTVRMWIMGVEVGSKLTFVTGQVEAAHEIDVTTFSSGKKTMSTPATYVLELRMLLDPKAVKLLRDRFIESSTTTIDFETVSPPAILKDGQAVTSGGGVGVRIPAYVRHMNFQPAPGTSVEAHLLVEVQQQQSHLDAVIEKALAGATFDVDQLYGGGPMQQIAKKVKAPHKPADLTIPARSRQEAQRVDIPIAKTVGRRKIED